MEDLISAYCPIAQVAAALHGVKIHAALITLIVDRPYLSLRHMSIELWDNEFKRLTPWDAILIRIARWQINRSKRKSINAGYPEIAAYVRDYIGIDIALYGYWEIDSLKALELICLRYGLRNTFVDIGANIGTYSLALGRNFSNVMAFEPNPETHSLLSHNLKFNLACNYLASQIALGDKSCSGSLSVTKSNRGGATLLHCNHKCDENVTVKVETLDGFLERHDRNCEKTIVDLIKIDVEGFESDVIEGAIDTIRSHQPLIAFEWSSSSRNNHSHVQILEDLGYEFFLTKRCNRHSLEIKSLWAKKGCMSLCPIKKEKLTKVSHHINLVIAIPLKRMR